MSTNTPKFCDYDVISVILSLLETKGRSIISEETNLGEGSIRTILERIDNLIETSNQGVSLNQNGKKIQNKLNNLFEIVKLPKKEYSNFLNDGFTTLILKTNNYENEILKHPYHARDCAIREGARGAMILEQIKGKICIKGMNDYEFDQVKEIFDEVLNDDIFLVVSAENERIVRNAMFSVINYISSDFRKLLKKIN